MEKEQGIAGEIPKSNKMAMTAAKLLFVGFDTCLYPEESERALTGLASAAPQS
jgi:hypothetical protein